MDNNTLVVQMLLDLQRQIEALKAENTELRDQNVNLSSIVSAQTGEQQANDPV